LTRFDEDETMSMSLELQLQPAAAAGLKQWHGMVERADLALLGSLLHPQAVFHSPMAHKPYASAQAVSLILNTVMGVFSDFKYHRQFASSDGYSVVLEFSAKVGEKALKGIDLIRFDVNGKIVEFEVMVRPMSGLQALGTEMGQRLSAFLPAYQKLPAE
jgi:hypothetical protein